MVTGQPASTGTRLEVGRGAAGPVFLYFGIPLVILGILLLAAARLAAQTASSVDQTCSMMADCQNPPDYSGALIAGGIVVLLIGIGLAGYGLVQYRS